MDVDLQACIDGDKQAWDAFVDRCSPVIWAAVRRVVGSGRSGPMGREVEDAVQNVFMRLVREDCRLLRTFDPTRASLTTWLTVVARSTAVDMLRRKRLDTVPIEHHDVATKPESTRTGPSVPLHLLSARQRLVLRMLFDEEKTVAEAARALHVDEQTIRSTKHKALSRLRKHFEPD